MAKHGIRQKLQNNGAQNFISCDRMNVLIKCPILYCTVVATNTNNIYQCLLKQTFIIRGGKILRGDDENFMRGVKLSQGRCTSCSSLPTIQPWLIRGYLPVLPNEFLLKSTLITTDVKRNSSADEYHPTPPPLPNQHSIFRPGLTCLTKCPALRWDILTKQAYYLLTLILQIKK